jgi:hypothetical protein
VKVKVFTPAFRKVWEAVYTAQTPPEFITAVPLLDKWGIPLANGLYYVTINTDQGFFKVKWLVLR